VTTAMLAVPCVWDEALVARLDPAAVAEVYGKLHADVVGGGRDATNVPRISRDGVAAHVAAVHARGLKFNYLLNATCLGNQEWTAAGQREIRELLDWVAAVGADCVTVGNPAVLELTRGYPFEVELSVRVHVDTPMRARYWEDQGVAQITLPFERNRDFAFLRTMRQAVSCRLQVIANLVCLFQCPVHQFHTLTGDHASQTHGARGSAYYPAFCEATRLTDPARYLSSPWIRPEDVPVYAGLGLERIKLVDRMMTSARLGGVIAAYTRGRHEGNLIDLLYLAERPVHLDNRRLDGFLDFFAAGKCPGDCHRCDYCGKVAAAALEIDPEYRTATRERLARACRCGGE
jgi:collagenase-like PrtC family protease